MAQSFAEKAHLNTDKEKYLSNYDRIFRSSDLDKIKKLEERMKEIQSDIEDIKHAYNCIHEQEDIIVDIMGEINELKR